MCHCDLIAVDDKCIFHGTSAPHALQQSPLWYRSKRSRATAEIAPRNGESIECRRPNFNAASPCVRRIATENGDTYERHCATLGRNLRDSARSLPARRVRPIDLATFPSGGELTSSPSASASVYPHHLTHLVEPPPDWIPPNIHGAPNRPWGSQRWEPGNN